MSRNVLYVVSALLFSAQLAHAQIRPPLPVPGNQSGSLRGKIVIPFSQVAERIEVVLEKSELQAVSRTFSDSLGNFEFANMAPGSYEVVVRLDGFQEARQRVDLAGGPASTAFVSVFLEPKAPESDDLAGVYPVIDVTELNRNYPKEALRQYEDAQEDIRKGNLTRALERLEAALQVAPDFYNARNSLGTVYQKLDRYRDAEREYNLARELNPRSAQPLVNLGSLYIQEADATRGRRRLYGRILDEALDALEEAVALNSHSAIAYYLLGTAYYKSSFLEEAEANLKRALELESHMGPARLMLANVYVRQQRWDTVLEQIDTYLAENPKAPNRAQIESVRVRVVANLQAQ